MRPPRLNPHQSAGVALAAAVARRDGAAIVSILDGTDDLRTLALVCATIAARDRPEQYWDAYLALIARDEAQASLDSMED